MHPNANTAHAHAQQQQQFQLQQQQQQLQQQRMAGMMVNSSISNNARGVQNRANSSGAAPPAPAVSVNSAAHLTHNSEPDSHTIQAYLNENQALIAAVLENHRVGKLAEAQAYQQRLQKNLMYLASLADHHLDYDLPTALSASPAPSTSSPRHASSAAAPSTRR